jgi:hypothetical protein
MHMKNKLSIIGTFMYSIPQQPYTPPPPPPPQEPVQQPPPPPPVVAYPGTPPVAMGAGMPPHLIAIIVVIGVILFFVGAIVCNASTITEIYDEPEDREEAQESARSMYKIGTIIADAGALVACIGIFYGALMCTRLEPALRVAMLSVGTAIIIVTLIVMLLGAPFGLMASATG